MKLTKIFFTLGICAIAIVVALGVKIAVKHNTIDVRGTVINVSRTDNDTCIYVDIATGFAGDFKVKVTDGSRIEYYDGEKKDIEDISVGVGIDIVYKFEPFKKEGEIKSAHEVILYPINE